MDMTIFEARRTVENAEKWMDIVDQIPAINFPKEWNVKIIPPFCGAVARFLAEMGDRSVSVYLDWYSQLGCMSQPYYEVYPNIDGDTSRFLLHETEEMMRTIQVSLQGFDEYSSEGRQEDE